jgi:hypothetical protein
MLQAHLAIWIARTPVRSGSCSLFTTAVIPRTICCALAVRGILDQSNHCNKGKARKERKERIASVRASVFPSQKKEREIHANLFSYKSDRYRSESNKKGEERSHFYTYRIVLHVRGNTYPVLVYFLEGRKRDTVSSFKKVADSVRLDPWHAGICSVCFG